MNWKLILLIVLLLFFLRPVRRAYFRHSRFLVPATLGAVGGLVLGSWLTQFGLPGWVVPIWGAMVGLIVGGVVKDWIEETFDGGDR